MQYGLRIQSQKINSEDINHSEIYSATGWSQWNLKK